MGSLPNLEIPPPHSRISTVVPATPRGEENGAYKLNYLDLLMKLHYIRPVYFFNSEAVQGLSISDLKPPMFPILDLYSHVSGRIRVPESGRPFIKCNDAGVRIAESHCDKTLREWFNENGYSAEGLVHDHVLGPDLSFSPLLFIKFTSFKCGGLSVGVSWAHVLGDAFSALNFITNWSRALAGQALPKSLEMPNLNKPQFLPNNSVSEEKNPFSIKKATIVGEYWLDANNNTHVATHSFHITSKQLHHLVTTTNQGTKIKPSYFEIISALVWKCISNIRGQNFEPRAVTICTSISKYRLENEIPNNGLVLSKIETDLPPGEYGVFELARFIGEKKMNENNVLEKLVEKGEGKEDFIVYGANLTFVDLEEAEMYEIKLNGKKPIMANCDFRGVGDQGVILILPAPEYNEGDGNGRMITVSLPGKELNKLKDVMGREWGIH